VCLILHLFFGVFGPRPKTPQKWHFLEDPEWTTFGVPDPKMGVQNGPPERPPKTPRRYTPTQKGVILGPPLRTPPFEIWPRNLSASQRVPNELIIKVPFWGVWERVPTWGVTASQLERVPTERVPTWGVTASQPIEIFMYGV
jgi:hypothetical protein